MWELDYKESWAPKNWCFWTVVLEKTLESPLDCQEIQPAHPKRNWSLIFTGRTDSEAETPILWPPDAMNWLIWKDSDSGKYWRREKGMRWLDGITDLMDVSLIPTSGRSLEGVNRNPLQYSCLKNPIDRGACSASVHGITEQLDTTEFKHIYKDICSVQFSCSVVSNSLQPHGLQHTRIPWSSPTPGACSNLCP